jgi:5,10-methylene-tetrahydrofolate dehydrogenase/methenyl tetrahydrofolate cyclohydrolase
MFLSRTLLLHRFIHFRPRTPSISLRAARLSTTTFSSFSMASILDGKACAATIQSELAARVSALAQKTNGRRPVLAVVLVGDRPDSATYVRMKSRACVACGIECRDTHLPASASQADILAAVAALNADAGVHGILVQLPLPNGVNEAAVLGCISPEKDVDGFGPTHMGALALKGHTPLFTPCTPRGVMELLRRSGVTVRGKHAVVLGRSNIVGTPVALLLLHADATVTVCHSQTADLAEHVRRADIVVAALGRPSFVKKEWVKPGAVVVDVGINQITLEGGKTKLVGDCDEACKEVAGMVTPVPGGVGPMTVACLMENVVRAFEHAEGVSNHA